MKTILFIFLAGLTACATDSGHSASTLSDGSVVHTVRCEESWDGCYLTASKICGELGFEEVARTSDGAVSSVGRLERMHTIDEGIEDHRYSENARVEAYNRVITIRCGPER